MLLSTMNLAPPRVSCTRKQGVASNCPQPGGRNEVAYLDAGLDAAGRSLLEGAPVHLDGLVAPVVLDSTEGAK